MQLLEAMQLRWGFVMQQVHLARSGLVNVLLVEVGRLSILKVSFDR